MLLTLVLALSAALVVVALAALWAAGCFRTAGDAARVTEIDADEFAAARLDPAVVELHQRADRYAAQYRSESGGETGAEMSAWDRLQRA